MMRVCVAILAIVGFMSLVQAIRHHEDEHEWETLCWFAVFWAAVFGILLITKIPVKPLASAVGSVNR